MRGLDALRIHDDPDHPPRARVPWLRWAAVGAFGVGLVLAYALLPLKDWLLWVAHELQAMGPVAVVLFVAAYTVGCLFFFPAALLSITAGVTWGPIGGFAVAVPAATLAATSAFLIGRYAFSGHFRAWLLHRPKLHAVDRAVHQKGPKLVFLLRFSPVLPFPMLNYGLGLTHIPLRGFVVATFFGMMPITGMWTYVGAIGADLSGLGGAEPGEIGAAKIALGVVGGLITIAVTFWVGRSARVALREAEAADLAEAALLHEPSHPAASSSASPP